MRIEKGATLLLYVILAHIVPKAVNFMKNISKILCKRQVTAANKSRSYTGNTYITLLYRLPLYLCMET